MNIENIQALIAQGLLTDTVSLDLTTTYVTVGVYQPGNRQNGPSGNAYPSYVLPLSQLAGSTYTASNGIALVGNDFQLGSLLISQFTNDSGYITSGGGTTDLDPVISQTNVVPGSPTLGDRYLAGTTPGAPWTANSIEEWDGASWITTAPVLDDVVFVTSTLSTLRYNGSVWVAYVGTAVLNQGNTTTSALVIGTNTAQALVFKTNNIESARVLSNGFWGFGTIVPDAKVHIKGTGFTSATYSLKVDNSASSPLLYVRNDGNVGFGESNPLGTVSILTKDDLITSFGIKLRQNVTGNDLFYIKGNGYSSFKERVMLGIGIHASSTSKVFIQGSSTASATDNILIATNYGGSLIGLIVKENSNVGIGKQDQTPTARLHVEGIDATSSNYALKVDNSASSSLLSIKNNGGYISNVYDAGYDINLYGSSGLYTLTTPWGDKFQASPAGAFSFTTGVNKGTSGESGVTNIFTPDFNSVAPWDVNANRIIVGCTGTQAGTITGLKIQKSGFTNPSATFYSAVFLNGNVGIDTSTPTSKLQVVGLSSYIDNATALGAGLTAGAMYIRTGHGLDIVV